MTAPSARPSAARAGPAPRARRLGIAFAIMLLPLLGANAASAAPARAADPPVTAVRGIVGAVEVRAKGPALRARATQDAESPVLVRIAEAVPEADGWTRFRVEFIGMVAGEYDLAERLECVDGTVPRLAPIRVQVVSQLEPDHGSDLFGSESEQWLRRTWYRPAMIALAALWIAVPVVVLLVRRMRRPPPPPPEPPPRQPTLADQLRPLVEAASAGTLDVTGRGRLELLLYEAWRRRLQMDAPRAEVVASLRRDRDAGALLGAVERWLHAPAGSGPSSPAEIAALLAPWESVAAVPEMAEAAT